jgi:hypothetical protein
MANAPAFHLQTSWLVKVDRFRAHQRRAVIVNNEFLLRIDDSKSRAERVARPVGCGTDHVASGQIHAEGIATAAAFCLGVGGGADMVPSANVRVGRYGCAQWSLQCGLLRATDQKRKTKPESYKFNRFTHWQNRASDSTDVSADKQLFAYQRIRTHPLTGFCRKTCALGQGLVDKFSRAMRTALRLDWDCHRAGGTIFRYRVRVGGRLLEFIDRAHEQKNRTRDDKKIN